MTGAGSPSPIPGSAGVVVVGVAPLRRAADHTSELVSQALLGETFAIEEISPDESWWRVRLDTDGYRGWLRSWYAVAPEGVGVAAWKRQAAGRVRDRQAEVLAAPRSGAAVLRALPWQSRLALGEPSGAWTLVRLPDGERGYVRKRALEDDSEGGPRVTAARLVRTASRLVGVPYLWGGRSSWGFDCSGFVQAAFAWHGVGLPRDSVDQRAAAAAAARGRGARQTSREPRSAATAGNLLFFGPDPDRVTHIALGAGGGEFLHAYGWVRRGSLDPSSPFFVPRLATIFLESWPSAALYGSATASSGLSA